MLLISFILNDSTERQLLEHLPSFQACFLGIDFSDEGHENLSECGLKRHPQERTPNPQKWNFRGEDLGRCD